MENNLKIDQVKKIHFIGIGGIGVSALARIFNKKGVEVSGSDLYSSKITKSLSAVGINVLEGGHDEKNITKDLDVVVYTVATEQDNPELLKANELGIPTMTYPEMLGLFTRDMYSVCISGSHGKTTTTAMTSLILEQGELDPTVVVGSNIKQFDGNARLGDSEYLVIESDEYKRAFLNYYPDVVILTSVEYEHPDIYKDLEDMLDAYREYIGRIPKDGLLIANIDDENIVNISMSAECQVLTYSLHDAEADYFVENETLNNGLYSYDIISVDGNINNVKLKVPGLFNIYNSIGAIVAAKYLKISNDQIKAGVANFEGTWRRLEDRGTYQGITIIDDYAHHPTEIKASLSAVRDMYPDNRITCVYQPHQKKRTQELYKDFFDAFADVDEVVMLDIYEVAGREEDIDVNSKRLAEEMREKGVNIRYIEDFEKALDYLVETKNDGDVIITMGAGTVTELADELVERLK